MIVLQGLAILAVVLVVFTAIGAITAALERLPTFPPSYLDEDVLPPPNPRTVVRRRWQVPE